jgi:hypothetical protein
MCDSLFLVEHTPLLGYFIVSLEVLRRAHLLEEYFIISLHLDMVNSLALRDVGALTHSFAILRGAPHLLELSCFGDLYMSAWPHIFNSCLTCPFKLVEG